MIRIIQAVMTPRTRINQNTPLAVPEKHAFVSTAGDLLSVGRSPADENLRYDRAFWPTGCFADRGNGNFGALVFVLPCGLTLIVRGGCSNNLLCVLRVLDSSGWSFPLNLHLKFRDGI
jgi:hypothetical protein